MYHHQWSPFTPTPPPTPELQTNLASEPGPPSPPRNSLAVDPKDGSAPTRVTKIVHCSLSSEFGLRMNAEVEHPGGYFRAHYFPEDLRLHPGAERALWDWFIEKGFAWKISEALNVEKDAPTSIAATATQLGGFSTDTKYVSRFSQESNELEYAEGGSNSIANLPKTCIEFLFYLTQCFPVHKVVQ